MFLRFAVAACAATIGLSLPAHATLLTTGAGDGSVVVDISSTGSSSQAIFDPAGAVGPADTFYYSDVFIPTDFGRASIGSLATNVSIVSQTDTQYVTSFDIGDLSVMLTQTLVDSYDGGTVTGSVLTQSFAITNTGADTSFDILRYLDADLAFDSSLADSGGIIQAGGTRVLFEIEADNVPGSNTTFVGINANVTGDNTSPDALAQNYEMNNYPVLQNDIIGGANLRDLIEGDSNGDGFIDGTYDVTMALQNYVTIPSGGTVVYNTATLFGNAVPPTPGSTEALPLLPNRINPGGGFEFALNAVDLVPGQIVWVDPVVATGYTFEVTGAEFNAVQMPSFASVPDSAYMLLVNGASYAVSSGDVFDFTVLGAPVTSFQITGIDPSLMLDPTDPTAFVVGLAFQNAIGASVDLTMTPITYDTDGNQSVVPLPAGMVLLLSGLGVMGGVASRRRRSHRG